jgi:hypothetical protein
MIVAMISVPVMQASIDQIINMVAVWNGFMAAPGPVVMGRVVSARSVLRRASIGVRLVHFDRVFFGVSVMYVLQMTMIEIIHMVPMLNSGVATAWAVNVGTCARRLIGGGHWFGFLGAV